jgi:hypothetical protein
MSRHKSMSRLRAILESVTLAAVASTGAVAAAPSLASAASLVSDRGCTAVGCPDAAASLDDLAHRLAACLTELPPLAAAGASAELATSPDVDDRAALAEALAWVFPLATDDVLIDHLADDPAPRVRAAVARAAWTRRAILGDTDVVRRLLGDADPSVRAAAWQAVKR